MDLTGLIPVTASTPPGTPTRVAADAQAPPVQAGLPSSVRISLRARQAGAVEEAPVSRARPEEGAAAEEERAEQDLADKIARRRERRRQQDDRRRSRTRAYPQRMASRAYEQAQQM